MACVRRLDSGSCTAAVRAINFKGFVSRLSDVSIFCPPVNVRETRCQRALRDGSKIGGVTGYRSCRGRTKPAPGTCVYLIFLILPRKRRGVFFPSCWRQMGTMHATPYLQRNYSVLFQSPERNLLENEERSMTVRMTWRMRCRPAQG